MLLQKWRAWRKHEKYTEFKRTRGPYWRRKDAAPQPLPDAPASASVAAAPAAGPAASAGPVETPEPLASASAPPTATAAPAATSPPASARGALAGAVPAAAGQGAAPAPAGGAPPAACVPDSPQPSSDSYTFTTDSAAEDDQPLLPAAPRAEVSEAARAALAKAKHVPPAEPAFHRSLLNAEEGRARRGTRGRGRGRGKRAAEDVDGPETTPARGRGKRGRST